MPNDQTSCPPPTPTDPPKITRPACPALAEDHLEPIRAFVHSRHGMLTRLTQEMQRRTSTPITRQAVSRWLHQDQAKRQEPKLGVFLVMEAAVKALQGAEQHAESADG